MPSIVKTLRVMADPNRLRILLLLKEEELSVAELQEILSMGQSTISTHLSQLRQAGLVEDRRTGKSSLYGIVPHLIDSSTALKGHDFSRAVNGSPQTGPLGSEGSSSDSTTPSLSLPEQDTFVNLLLSLARAEIPQTAADRVAMRRVLAKRQDRMRAFFDSVAGRLGRDYVPGKSWKSLAEALLHLLPPLAIADMGAGEGAFALMLAQRARKVIAIDSSARMIEVGRELALRHGMANIDFRLGDMEQVPIGDGEVEAVFFSQSLHHALRPARALEEAFRILSPGGRVIVLDLLRHRFEEAREIYADQWLGFAEAEIESLLQGAGFADVRIAIADKEPEAPHFQTLLAAGCKEQPLSPHPLPSPLSS